MMDNFKKWYKERKGKYILFFGFYLIFFIFFGIYMSSSNNNKPPKNEEKETTNEIIKTYNLSHLINNNYRYTIEIIDNYETIYFNGTKNNVDYANYPNKYFLDIYNINQLLKRSDYVNSNSNILEYKLANKEINDILLTDKQDEYNKILVYVNDKSEVEKIVLDLSNYLEKEMYQITINYMVGESNEASSS
jgi:hypothetical protein